MRRRGPRRWAFTWNADDTNLIVDSQGMCLDGRFRTANLGLAMPVAKCGFKEVWRFAYRSLGLIMNVKNNKCLSVPGAVSNAAVSLVTCDDTRQAQLWMLSH